MSKKSGITNKNLHMYQLHNLPKLLYVERDLPYPGGCMVIEQGQKFPGLVSGRVVDGIYGGNMS